MIFASASDARRLVQLFGTVSAFVRYPIFFPDASWHRLRMLLAQEDGSERAIMLKELDAHAITELHDTMLAEPDGSTAQYREDGTGVWHWIIRNHQYNALLWSEEDKARRTDVGHAAIAASKRLIDQYNQKRNDAVEAIDEAILAQLEKLQCRADARLHSETAGAMIDRLSILSLKIFHMREQTQRLDASVEHIACCSAKLQRLAVQRQDLGSCFDQLLTDARQGRAYFKVYRQFKMYNDPALNPYLYASRGRVVAGDAAP